MLVYLSALQDIWGPLRIFKYVTFRCIGSMVTAACIGFAIAPFIIEKLKQLKMEQVFRNKKEVGVLADLHAKKKHTPTMGGIIIYVSVMVSVCIWIKFNTYVCMCLGIYTLLMLIGFYDDYSKISMNSMKGFRGKWKLLLQALITIGAIGILFSDKHVWQIYSQIYIPFMKQPLFTHVSFLGICIFFFFVMAGSSHAINLTDGVDGLAIGCTITVALTYAIMAYAAGNHIVSEYLFISYIPGAEELAVISMSLVGAGLAFLWHNCSPATIFMGDTGSLALGGIIGSIAFLIHQPFTLIIVGGIFVLEAVSVILQVGFFKIRGKRIFKMAPIHHHFELKGWPETKVVIRFWIISLLCALLGLSTLKLR